MKDADRKDYEKETAEIRERAKEPGAKERHEFEAARWTHPNGHPRCRLCGSEESMSGWCNSPADDKAVSEAFDATEHTTENRDRVLEQVRARVLKGDESALSREFLEEVWREAKRALPGWAYASLRYSARSRAGGRAAHREDVPTTIEKIALAEIRPARLRDLPDDEIGLVWLRLHQWFAAARRRREPTEDYVNAAAWALDEMRRRGLEANGSDLVEAVEAFRAQAATKGALGRLANLPRDVVVVRDFISVVGSAAKGDKAPADLDVLVRAPWDRDAGQIAIQAENVWLPVRNILDPEKAGDLHWIPNPQGPHGDHVPVYDLILRRREGLHIEIVKEEPAKRGVMVALMLPEKAAAGIALEGGEPAERLHCTLCYLGREDVLPPNAVARATRAVAEVAAAFGPVVGSIGGAGRFNATPSSDGRDVVHATLDAPTLGALRESLATALEREGLPVKREHGFDPHITLAYVEPGKAKVIPRVPTRPVVFEAVSIVAGVERLDVPLLGLRIFKADSSPVSEAQVRTESACAKTMRPFGDYTPPKPEAGGATELAQIDDLWAWAKGRLPVAVEPKHNGCRAVLEKDGEQVRLWFEGAREDVADRIPGLRAAAERIPGAFVLDLDVGIERNGKRLPRTELQRLNADEPAFTGGERPVLTAFDLPYRDGDLSGQPWEKRREELERFVNEDLRGSDLFRLSPARSVRSREALRAAARWGFDQDRSEGLVAKAHGGAYATGGSTNEWSTLKRAAEVKAVVLERKRTKSGAYAYRGGLAPGAADYANTEEHGGKQFVDLGWTANTEVEAEPGDILTVEVLELIPDEEKNTLAWLGPTVAGVDRARTEPYAVRQALDIATRARVMQKALAVVPAAGPVGAPVAFVGAAPDAFDVVVGEPLTGAVGEVFRKAYLEPLGLRREQVAILQAVPTTAPIDQAAAAGWVTWLSDELDRLHPQTVIALGQVAKTALGERAAFTLPHPTAIRKRGDSGEIVRKVRQIKRTIDGADVAFAKQPARGEGGEETRGFRSFRTWEDTWHEQLPRSGKGRFVYQHHWRGLDEDQARRLGDAELIATDHSLHGDLRFEGNGEAWGWAVMLGSTADNRAAGGDKLFALARGRLDQDKLQLANKLPQPLEWLEVGVDRPLVTRPGEAGATSEKWSKFFALDEGTYTLGVARQHGVEIFLDGKHLKGRYLLQFAPVGDRRIWLLDKPTDQEPMADQRDLADVMDEVRQRRQRYLIWGRPGTRPRKIDVRTGEAVKAAPAVQITKADPVKRIVYGVVLDPYGKTGPEADAHNDWTPPADIERAAHDYMKSDRVVGLQHRDRAKARVVESWVEQYPTRADYLKAIRNEPHKVYRRPFGDDVLHSGAWVMGVELGEDEWQAYEEGEINAFSPGGFGVRTAVERRALPSVTFVELVPKRA